MKRLRKQLQLLIDKAIESGLPDKDVIHAGDFLEHHEYALCLNEVGTQLYHYGIRIDAECYEIFVEITDLLQIPLNEYDYLKELL